MVSLRLHGWLVSQDLIPGPNLNPSSFWNPQIQNYPWKINMSPEKVSFQKEISFSNHWFFIGYSLVFGGAKRGWRGRFGDPDVRRHMDIHSLLRMIIFWQWYFLLNIIFWEFLFVAGSVAHGIRLFSAASTSTQHRTLRRSSWPKVTWWSASRIPVENVFHSDVFQWNFHCKSVQVFKSIRLIRYLLEAILLIQLRITFPKLDSMIRGQCLY